MSRVDSTLVDSQLENQEIENYDVNECFMSHVISRHGTTHSECDGLAYLYIYMLFRQVVASHAEVEEINFGNSTPPSSVRMNCKAIHDIVLSFKSAGY